MFRESLEYSFAWLDASSPRARHGVANLPPCPLDIASSGISRHPAQARSSLLGSATVKGFEAFGGVTA
jgi:hypothetical protein